MKSPILVLSIILIGILGILLRKFTAVNKYIASHLRFYTHINQYMMIKSIVSKSYSILFTFDNNFKTNKIMDFHYLLVNGRYIFVFNYTDPIEQLYLLIDLLLHKNFPKPINSIILEFNDNVDYSIIDNIFNVIHNHSGIIATVHITPQWDIYNYHTTPVYDIITTAETTIERLKKYINLITVQHGIHNTNGDFNIISNSFISLQNLIKYLINNPQCIPGTVIINKSQLLEFFKSDGYDIDKQTHKDIQVLSPIYKTISYIFMLAAVMFGCYNVIDTIKGINIYIYNSKLLQQVDGFIHIHKVSGKIPEQLSSSINNINVEYLKRPYTNMYINGIHTQIVKLSNIYFKEHKNNLLLQINGLRHLQLDNNIHLSLENHIKYILNLEKQINMFNNKINNELNNYTHNGNIKNLLQYIPKEIFYKEANRSFIALIHQYINTLSKDMSLQQVIKLEDNLRKWQNAEDKGCQYIIDTYELINSLQTHIHNKVWWSQSKHTNKHFDNVIKLIITHNIFKNFANELIEKVDKTHSKTQKEITNIPLLILNSTLMEKDNNGCLSISKSCINLKNKMEHFIQMYMIDNHHDTVEIHNNNFQYTLITNNFIEKTRKKIENFQLLEKDTKHDNQFQFNKFLKTSLAKNIAYTLTNEINTHNKSTNLFTQLRNCGEFLNLLNEFDFIINDIQQSIDLKHFIHDYTYYLIQQSKIHINDKYLYFTIHKKEMKDSPLLDLMETNNLLEVENILDKEFEKLAKDIQTIFVPFNNAIKTNKLIDAEQFSQFVKDIENLEQDINFKIAKKENRIDIFHKFIIDLKHWTPDKLLESIQTVYCGDRISKSQLQLEEAIHQKYFHNLKDVCLKRYNEISTQYNILFSKLSNDGTSIREFTQFIIDNKTTIEQLYTFFKPRKKEFFQIFTSINELYLFITDPNITISHNDILFKDVLTIDSKQIKEHNIHLMSDITILGNNKIFSSYDDSITFEYSIYDNLQLLIDINSEKIKVHDSRGYTKPKYNNIMFTFNNPFPLTQLINHTKGIRKFSSTTNNDVYYFYIQIPFSHKSSGKSDIIQIPCYIHNAHSPPKHL